MTGTNGPKAWLGESIFINVISNTATTVGGMLSPGIPVSDYGLTVQNPDSQWASLSPAFTVYPPPGSADVTSFITFGPTAMPGEGDDDHVQIVFFEVPDAPDDLLYIRIFDPDIGGGYDQRGADESFGDTVMTYTVRGGGGAYSEDDARSDHPGATGISSGTVITQQVVGDAGADWLTLPVSRTQGEQVGNNRVFKLAVQGASGNDGNWYQVSMSSVPTANLAVAGSRVFAFSWCLVLPGLGVVARYPYVPQDTITVTQFNFDFGFMLGNNSTITLTTRFRDLIVSAGGMSGDSVSAFESFSTFIRERNETGTTWGAWYSSSPVLGNNVLTIWFMGDGTALPIYTSPP